MDKYEALQEGQCNVYRMKFSGVVDIQAHSALEAKMILEGLTFSQIQHHDIDWMRKLDNDEEIVFGGATE